MQHRRRVISSLLTIIVVLFVSIYVGVNIGDRIRMISVGQGAVASTLPTPVPEEEASRVPLQTGWKHIQVVVAATDPGFPDPRITPTPQPPQQSPSLPPPSSVPSPANDSFMENAQPAQPAQSIQPTPNAAQVSVSRRQVPAGLLMTANPLPPLSIASSEPNVQPTVDDLGD